jgi:hypothetical protein
MAIKVIMQVININKKILFVTDPKKTTDKLTIKVPITQPSVFEELSIPRVNPFLFALVVT